MVLLLLLFLFLFLAVCSYFIYILEYILHAVNTNTSERGSSPYLHRRDRIVPLTSRSALPSSFHVEEVLIPIWVLWRRWRLAEEEGTCILLYIVCRGLGDDRCRRFVLAAQNENDDDIDEAHSAHCAHTPRQRLHPPRTARNSASSDNDDTETSYRHRYDFLWELSMSVMACCIYVYTCVCVLISACTADAHRRRSLLDGGPILPMQH